METAKLNELATLINGRAYLMPELQKQGKYRIVRVGNFTGKDEWYYSDMELAPEKYCEDGDLLFKWACTFGPEYWHGEKSIYHYHIWKVVVNDLLMDKDYLYYYLKLMTPKWLCATNGSTMVHLTKETMENEIVSFPSSLGIQKAVAATLRLLDDAIENNNSVCSDLEAAAKLLYDYWFVQYDFPDENGKPYKSSGGKMVWNDELKREIPAGWSVGNLYDIAEYANGLACQKYRPLEGDKGLPVIKIKEMHGGYSSETERVKSNIPDKNIVRPGDLLFSWSASLEVMIWTRQTGGLNQHIFKVIPKRPFNRSYVYFQLGSYLAQFKRMAESRKTTMGHITSDHLEQSRIVLPPSTLLDMYSNKTSSLIDQIVEVSGVAETLTDIRDYTLPLLMNGQVTIGDDGK